MEEWQNPDSGYLNCICVGDTYVKKQIARILNTNVINAASIVWIPNYEKPQRGLDVWANNLKFVKRENNEETLDKKEE